MRPHRRFWEHSYGMLKPIFCGTFSTKRYIPTGWETNIPPNVTNLPIRLSSQRIVNHLEQFCFILVAYISDVFVQFCVLLYLVVDSLHIKLFPNVLF